MHTSTRLWLFVTMLAVLLGAQLLERELTNRRRRSDLHRLRQALLAPLEPATLPPIPGREERPRFETYTVKPGDTLGGIAKRLLGTARAYPLLLELNRDQLSKPSALRVGMRLLIPDPEWLRSRAERKRKERRQRHPTTARNQATQITKNTYVVQPGDTLGAIAQKTLGSVRHTNALLEANRDVIQDPRRLQVGTKLRIPARANLDAR